MLNMHSRTRNFQTDPRTRFLKILVFQFQFLNRTLARFDLLAQRIQFSICVRESTLQLLLKRDICMEIIILAIQATNAIKIAFDRNHPCGDLSPFTGINGRRNLV